MSNVETYLKQKNSLRTFLNEPALKNPTSEEECREIIDMLNCDCSPENLHCDGEISRTQAMTKMKFYKAVRKELEDRFSTYFPEEY